MAKGMPSNRRTTWAMVEEFLSVTVKVAWKPGMTAGTFDEQAHGGIFLGLVQAGNWWVWLTQRWHPVGNFPSHPQHLAAGGQDGQLRAGMQQTVGQIDAGLQQVLAVIQRSAAVSRAGNRPPSCGSVCPGSPAG